MISLGHKILIGHPKNRIFVDEKTFCQTGKKNVDMKSLYFNFQKRTLQAKSLNILRFSPDSLFPWKQENLIFKMAGKMT